MILGYPVLETMPNFAEAPRMVGKMKTGMVDLSDARRLNSFIGRKPLHVLNHRFLFHTREDAELFEDFFDEVCGTWGAFWVPSWHAELNPVADVAEDATELSITPVNYPTRYDPTTDELNDLGHYIFFLHYDGTLEIKKVTAAASGTPEVLTLDTGVSREYKVGQFIVGFVYFVRFLSDELALDFSGADHVEIEVGMTEVQDEVLLEACEVSGANEFFANCYEFVGYDDGDIENTTGTVAAIDYPRWDGTFQFTLDSELEGYVGFLGFDRPAVEGDGHFPAMDDRQVCNVYLSFSCVGSVRTWTFTVRDNEGTKIIEGTKTGSYDPAGVYTNNGGGYDASPASWTIALLAGTPSELEEGSGTLCIVT